MFTLADNEVLVPPNPLMLLVEKWPWVICKQMGTALLKFYKTQKAVFADLCSRFHQVNFGDGISSS